MHKGRKQKAIKNIISICSHFFLGSERSLCPREFLQSDKLIFSEKQTLADDGQWPRWIGRFSPTLGTLSASKLASARSWRCCPQLVSVDAAHEDNVASAALDSSLVKTSGLDRAVLVHNESVNAAGESQRDSVWTF